MLVFIYYLSADNNIMQLYLDKPSVFSYKFIVEFVFNTAKWEDLKYAYL